MIFRIRVLSPVHIGNGNAISPLEYFIENNSFVRIDMDKLFNDPDFIPQMRTFIDKAGFERNISKILSQNLYKKHPLYALSVHSSAKGSNPIEVREYIKSAGRVFIPGSSIKGSILSGVMETILKIKNVRELSDFRTLLGIVLNEITGSSMNEFSRWI
ncbi:MAG: type III-A CRISPR-associated RAMP protein Csm5, partial [Candidatus Omnitrophica bacterium]|nr:type III-A CRISPR-associated RAMP protein Csm5 [Candidatus Omnitrophota bacterium]